MESTSICNYADLVFSNIGQFDQTKSIAVSTFNKSSHYFSSGYTRVAALYPNRKAGNAFTVKLASHAKEMKALRGVVDCREAVILRRAQKTAKMFRVRGN